MMGALAIPRRRPYLLQGYMTLLQIEGKLTMRGIQPPAAFRAVPERPR